MDISDKVGLTMFTLASAFGFLNLVLYATKPQAPWPGLLLILLATLTGIVIHNIWSD